MASCVASSRRKGVDPHGPAPASDDPYTPVNKDEKVLTQKATHAG